MQLSTARQSLFAPTNGEPGQPPSQHGTQWPLLSSQKVETEASEPADDHETENTELDTFVAKAPIVDNVDEEGGYGAEGDKQMEEAGENSLELQTVGLWLQAVFDSAANSSN